MKVAYLLNIFPKISETFILNEMLEIQSKGISIGVFAYHDSKEEKTQPRAKEIKDVQYFFKANLFQIIYAHLFWLSRKPVCYVRMVWFILRHGDRVRKLFLVHLYDTVRVYQWKPDHLHAYFGEALGDVASANLAMVLHLLSGIPYTFTTYAHDIFDMPATNYPIKSKLAVKHVTVSDYNKRYLIEKLGVDEKDIEVIFSGIDFRHISAFANKKIPSAKKPLILCIARLSKEKGLDILVKACKRLADQGMEFECIIVGDGAEREYLARLIKENGLSEKVILAGYQTQPQVFEWLNQATLMALPSYSEGIPLSLMEAMAFRVPVVSTRICGIPELIEDGESGFLVKPGDPEGLSERIKQLLSDEALRQKFTETGYKKVYEDFNLKTVMDKLLNIWPAAATGANSR